VHLLESVVLNLENWRHDDIKNMVDALVSSPRLHKFDWMETFGYHLPIYHEVPWDRLTAVGLHRFGTLERALEVLTRSPNLEEFQFGDIFADPLHNPPHLTTKIRTLSMTSVNSIHALLPYLTFPDLRKLRIHDEFYHPLWQDWASILPPDSATPKVSFQKWN